METYKRDKETTEEWRRGWGNGEGKVKMRERKRRKKGEKCDIKQNDKRLKRKKEDLG